MSDDHNSDMCVWCLRAKLQEAESRAEAAEAALKSLIDLTKYSGEVKELLSDPLMIAVWIKEGIEGANALRDETLEENQRLQAEVARLTHERDQWRGSVTRVLSDESALRTRIAELEAIIRKAPDLELTKKGIEYAAIAAALRWAANNKPGGHMDRGSWTYETDAEYISRCLKALLGEGK